jgi:cystathionine gamma-lyase
MTHVSIPPAEREALGIEGVVYLGCRIKEVEDLVEDVRDGLDGRMMRIVGMRAGS